ncbi:MAG: hypothetical protein HZB65_02680 [Candidatus Aenigmarchaeota archaeon]|nr:hypothetical protein [Candidatus Aenigmarchaeota archaeon]
MLKGQIFIAGAIVILVLIAIAVTGLRYESPSYDKFIYKDADNLDKEFRFSTMAGGPDEFIAYLDKNINGFRAFYVTADSKTIIANYLGEKTVFTIETDGFLQSFEWNNGQKSEIDRSFTRFNITYAIDGIENSEEISVKGRTVFIDYMIQDRNLARKKVIYYTQTQ